VEMGYILAYASLARALRALSSGSQPGANPHRIEIKTTCWSGRYQNEERGAHFCTQPVLLFGPPDWVALNQICALVGVGRNV
jgi:hypothetical protein